MYTETTVIEGAKELQVLLAKMPGRASSILGGALYECAQEIGKQSLEITPKLAGNLRNSQQITKPERAGDGVEVTIGYGGAAINYATYVHEAPPELNWTLPGTGPKFLERPAKEYPLGTRLGAKVRGRLERAMAGKGM